MPMARKELDGWLNFARDVGDRGEDDAVGAILALDNENRKLREVLCENGKTEAERNKPLIDALAAREREYRDAIDRIRSAVENDTGASNAVCLLREAVEL